MRNFPKNLKTKEDIYNCLEMVRAGELRAADLTKAIKKIKNQNYINAEITGVSEDRKTVTTRYIAEADEGSRAKVGATVVTVKAVTHGESEPDEQGKTSLVSSDITVSKAVAKGAETFALEKIPSVYDKYGVTESELNAILDELAE
jgi:hypothetical protein